MTQPINKDNVGDYLAQYHVVSTDDIDCKAAAQILYTCFVRRFLCEMTQQESDVLSEYQQRVADLIDELRDLDPIDLRTVFTHLDENNKYLLDVVIMAWCHPRPRVYRSTIIYGKRHIEMIAAHQKTLYGINDHFTLDNFRSSTLTRDGHVPIECIDYLWCVLQLYKNMDIQFANAASGGYLGLRFEIVPESDEEIVVVLTFNLCSVVKMGVGQLSGFVDFLKSLVLDPEHVTCLLDSPSRENYLHQARELRDVWKWPLSDLIEAALSQ